MVKFFRIVLKILPFAGFALVAAAVGIALRQEQMDQLPLFLIGLGFVLLLAMFLKIEGASLRYYLNLIVLTILMLGNVTLAYLLVGNHPFTWDLTRGSLHTLAPQTQKILRNLKKNVEVEVLVDRNEPYASYLERYKALSDRLRCRIESPYRKTALSQQFGEQVKANQVWVRCGDKVSAFSLEPAEDIYQISRKFESELVNAILTVIQDRPIRLYLTTGHGEKSLDFPGRDDLAFHSLRKFADSLQKAGMEIRGGLDLKRDRLVPQDCDALILAGPALDLVETEVDAIRTYLDAGGSLLVLFDPPNIERLRRPFLRALLGNYGVDVTEEIVADYGSYAAEQDYFAPLVRDFAANHPITEKLHGSGRQLPLYLATVVRARKEKPPDLSVSEILFSSGESWAVSVAAFQEIAKSGKMAPPPKEQWAEQPLAAAVKSALEEADRPGATRRRPRIVVIGDSDFLTNPQLGEIQEVLGYFAINWLTRQSDLIEIPPHDPEVTHMTLNPRQSVLVGILAIVAIPFTIFFGGLAYTTIRRRRG